MKKRIIFQLSAITAICGFIALQSCKKDPVVKPDDTTTTNVKPYILVNGFKYYCAKQKSLSISTLSGDTILTWTGTGTSDTILSVRHIGKDIKIGKYTFDSTGASDPGFCTATIRWGTNISSPKINLAKGDYEIKKENGKFVSYLKNGEAYNGTNHKDRYYNIEFKVIWPY